MSANTENDISREEPEEEAASGGPDMLQTLKHYLVLGAVPVLALVALGMAAAAFLDARSARARLDEVAAEVQSANESLMATRNELENLKFIMSRQKAQLDAEKKQEERLPPTVPEPAPQHAVPQTPGTTQTPDKKVETKSGTKQPAVSPAPSAPKAAAKPAGSTASAKTSPTASGKTEKTDKKQLQGIREAIEKFNQRQ